MTRPLRAFLALARMESLQLLRTSETWTFFLLPACLTVPLLVVALSFALSVIDRRERVAVPVDTPPELPIEEELAGEGLRAVWLEDPAAALDRGEVDAAILAWEDTDRPRPSSDEADEAVHWRWMAEVAGAPELEGRVTDAVEAAGNRALESWVAQAGGEIDRDLWLATSKTLSADGSRRNRAEPGALELGYAVHVLGFVSFFVIALGTASERVEGVAETLAVSAVPPWVPLAVRLLVPTALELLGAGLFVGSVFLLLPDRHPTALTAALALVRVACALVLLNASYLLVGLGAKTAKAAYNLASVPLVLSAGLAFAGLVELPAWVPLLGVLSAEGAGGVATGALSTLGLAALLVTSMARFVGYEGLRLSRGTGE